MPRHKTRSAASGSRAVTDHRKKRSKPVRRQRATDTPTAAAGFNHIATLTFSPLVGTEVFCAMAELTKDKTGERMLKDLFDCYVAACKGWNDGMIFDTSFLNYPFLKSPGKAIWELMRLFEHQFCEERDSLVIDEIDGKYCFCIYRVIEHSEQWNVIEMKKVVASVSKVSRALRDVTLSFMRTMKDQFRISSWYGGSMEDAEQWVQDEIETMQEEYFDECFEQLKNKDKDSRYYQLVHDLNSQKVGAAAYCAQLLCQAKQLTPDEILKKVSAIRKKHPMKKVLIAGCEMLKQPYSMQDYYGYYKLRGEIPDGPTEEGLPFDETFLVLYEYNNMITYSWEEWINSRANEGGIEPPVVCFPVTADRTEWDRTAFNNSHRFPAQLERLFQMINDACIGIKPEPIKNYQ